VKENLHRPDANATTDGAKYEKLERNRTLQAENQNKPCGGNAGVNPGPHEIE